MESSTTFGDVPLKITLQTEPALAAMDLLEPQTQSDPNFDLSVDITHPDPDSQLVAWRLRRRDDSPFKVVSFRVDASVPGINLHRMFVPVLHDAIGKALNVPVYQLLGGKVRDRVAFAYPIKPCSVPADVDANLARIDWIQDLGHPTIRYYFGADLSLDEKFLSTLRKRWGDKVEINALDASGRFEVDEAINVFVVAQGEMSDEIEYDEYDRPTGSDEEPVVGPATPVVDTPTSVSKSSRTRRAISSAVAGLTVPSLLSRSALIPSTRVLEPPVYAMTPP